MLLRQTLMVALSTQCLIFFPFNPSRPNAERREKIKLNFYFNTTFRNARGGKGYNVDFETLIMKFLFHRKSHLLHS